MSGLFYIMPRWKIRPESQTMNTIQLERAAYLAAHEILTADISAPQLACPGARRSHAVDAVANIIKSIFTLHGDAPGEDRERRNGSVRARPEVRMEDIAPPGGWISTAAPREKILHLRAEVAVQSSSPACA